MHTTKLESFLNQNNLSPGRIARESGYSRQHLLRLRRGEMEPTRAAMVAVATACGRLLERPVRPSELFELDVAYGRGSVLLAEDDTFVAAAVRMLLEEEGFAVRHVPDAAEALEAASQRPSLAVLDIGLGRDDGRDLAVSLREIHPRLPILFVSGHVVGRGALGVFASDERAGMLQKPFSKEQLAAALTQLLPHP